MIFSHVFTCNISVGDGDGEMKCTLSGLAGGWGSGGQGCPVGNGEGMGSLLVLAKAKYKAVRMWSKAQPL